jgi:hypothetical protein
LVEVKGCEFFDTAHGIHQAPEDVEHLARQACRRDPGDTVEFNQVAFGQWA